jgi:hypothetical protein
MKAERRHELKTNTLAKNLENAPAFFQQHGSRILLGVILCLLAYILTTNYLTSKATKAHKAGEALGNALNALHQLKSLPPQARPGDLAAQRKALTKDAELAIADVLDNTSDPKLKAQALVARGDLNWTLANFPALPGSTTRPELQFDNNKTKDDLLSAAAEAYGEVLQPPMTEDHVSVTAARFGLAYIAENRLQWDKARNFYQQVIDDGSTDKSFKDFARERIDALANLQKPLNLGSPADNGSMSNFRPSAIPPATPRVPQVIPPATQPVSIPKSTSIPTTRPSQP